jgi:hypothetical protein
MGFGADERCPERRPDDGQTILECIRTGLKSFPDLVLLVELSGLEPLTSCMPREMLTFKTGKCQPEMTRAARCRTGRARNDGRATGKRS